MILVPKLDHREKDRRQLVQALRALGLSVHSRSEKAVSDRIQSLEKERSGRLRGELAAACAVGRELGECR